MELKDLTTASVVYLQPISLAEEVRRPFNAGGGINQQKDKGNHFKHLHVEEEGLCACVSILKTVCLPASSF